MGCFSSKDPRKGTVPSTQQQTAVDGKYPAHGTGLYSNQQKAATVDSIYANPYEEAPQKPASLPQYPPPASAYQQDPAAAQYPAGVYPPQAGAYPATRMAQRRRRRPAGRAGLLGGGAGGLGLGLLLGSGGGGFGGGGCGGGGCGKPLCALHDSASGCHVHPCLHQPLCPQLNLCRGN